MGWGSLFDVANAIEVIKWWLLVDIDGDRLPLRLGKLTLKAMK